MLFRKSPEEMNNFELMQALQTVEKTLNKALEKRNNPKYLKKFENQPPPAINPTFAELKEKINQELERRKTSNDN